jgi:hypothetical protein
MDSVPLHVLQHRVPESGMSFTYRGLLFIEVAFFIERMFFVFNYFRGVNH